MSERERALLEGACDLIRQAARLAAPQPTPDQFEFAVSYMTIRLLNSMCSQQRADSGMVGEALSGVMKAAVVYACNVVKMDVGTEERLQYLRNIQQLFDNQISTVALATLAGKPEQEKMWGWLEKAAKRGVDMD